MAPSIAIKRPPEAVTAAVVRAAPVVLLVAALVVLVAAEFSTLREIKAVTVVPEGGTTSGGSHHGYALAVIAVAARSMGFGAPARGLAPGGAGGRRARGSSRCSSSWRSTCRRSTTRA